MNFHETNVVYFGERECTGSLQQRATTSGMRDPRRKKMPVADNNTQQWFHATQQRHGLGIAEDDESFLGKCGSEECFWAEKFLPRSASVFRCGWGGRIRVFSAGSFSHFWVLFIGNWFESEANEFCADEMGNWIRLMYLFGLEGMVRVLFWDGLSVRSKVMKVEYPSKIFSF